MTLFELATRLKLRFDTQRGQITIEDLWDLPLTTTGSNVNLDDVAMALNREIKESQEESFVVKKTKANNVLELKLDIVKHIIDTRLAENEAALSDKLRKQEIEKLQDILAEKEDETLKNKSTAALRKRLKELQEL